MDPQKRGRRVRQDNWIFATKEKPFVMSWCGTAKFDWFALLYESDEADLTESTSMTHISVDDLSTPHLEPLDVILLHVVEEPFRQIGQYSPRFDPMIAFAPILHDHQNPSNGQILLLDATIPGTWLRKQQTWNLRDEKSGEELGFAGKSPMQGILDSGFKIIPGLDLLEPNDLKKLASKFRTRVRKAMR